MLLLSKHDKNNAILSQNVASLIFVASNENSHVSCALQQFEKGGYEVDIDSPCLNMVEVKDFDYSLFLYTFLLIYIGFCVVR